MFTVRSDCGTVWCIILVMEQDSLALSFELEQKCVILTLVPAYGHQCDFFVNENRTKSGTYF